MIEHPSPSIGVWFPAIRTGTGTDVFTLQLCNGLNAKGIRAEITWLPHRTEYLPWFTRIPATPSWATIAHLNTWIHKRFIPDSIPTLATMHLCVHDPALSPYKKKTQSLYHQHWIRPIEETLLQRVQKVVAVSHYTAQITQEQFQLNNRIPVIHNGIPIPASVVRPARDASQPFRLLYVGNWSKRKGVDLLADLMQALGSGFELHYTADAHGAHQRASLPANCKCIGRLDHENLRQAYCSAHALIFPSRLEGLPLTVIEAMSNSLPVIGANTSSLPELITNKVTGILFPQDDVAKAVKAVRTLESDFNLSQVIGLNSRNKVISDLSLEAMVNAYVKIYEDIAFGFSDVQ